MGSSRYSDVDYTARSTFRSTKGIPTFKHDADIKSGAVKAAVHPSLSPKGVKVRESRDSADQNKVPVIISLDTTGSMADVPVMIQAALPKLMGGFIGDKASGKRYLGDKGYPDIMVGAVDDYNAMRGYGGSEGCLQVGQFESGLEIDDNLTNLWMTGHGGGTYEESYDLALYFAARHTTHDHWEKRGRKGYMFIIGDEHCYPAGVSKTQVKEVIGDSIQDNISLEDIIAEVKTRYHLFFTLPNMTSHYHDTSLHKYWTKLVGQQNFLLLEDPSKVCELITSSVAICESNIGLDDLAEDGIDSGVSSALALLSSTGGTVAGYSGSKLPVVPGAAGKTTRL